MDASTYLNFNGQCEEAFTFYAKCFGGKVEAMMTFEGMPDGSGIPAEWKKKIMHAHLNIGSAAILGSDAPPPHYNKPQGYSVALNADTVENAERIFKDLSEGGTVTMAMSETFFAPRFGQVTDRFGIPWMVLCNGPA